MVDGFESALIGPKNKMCKRKNHTKLYYVNSTLKFTKEKEVKVKTN